MGYTVSLTTPSMPNAVARYAVVTPVRDEEEYLEATIELVTGQTLRPIEWAIVDDGSKDRTGEIIDAAAVRYPWIRAVHREDRGYRMAGSGVMEAFYAGFAALETKDWDFLVKLDGDLQFSSDYFGRCLEQFGQDPKLGIGGGVIFNRINDALVLERHPKFHVRGATKIYRRACWEQIGGLLKVKGWDTLDEVKANMLGWTTTSFPEIHLTQNRFTGDAAGQWSNWIKNGRASYVAGYHPFFLIARSLTRLTRRPYLVASIGLLIGYFGALIRRVPLIDDRDLVRYVRRQQLRRVFGLSSIWR